MSNMIKNHLFKISVNTGSTEGKIYPFKCDMGDIENIQAMFEWIENQSDLGKVDICINNAGICVPKVISETSPEEMKITMNTNVIAASLCTQLSIKLMLKQKIDDGQIIFISR